MTLTIISGTWVLLLLNLASWGRTHAFQHHRGKSNRTGDSLVLDCLYETNVKDMKWPTGRLELITTRTLHPFVMSVLPRSIDSGVGEKLRLEGTWDPQVLGPFQFILQSKPCDADSFVIDVGANIGFFSLVSLSMGCDTAMFEVNPVALSAIRASLCINEHIYRRRRQKFQLIPLAVSPLSSINFPVADIQNRRNTGGMGTGDCNDGKVKCHEVKTVQLDNFMYGPMKSFSKTKIRVLKVDVEGFEGDVLKTMSQVFEKNDVENILFESIPYIHGLDEAKAAFDLLFKNGFSVAECPFTFAEGIRDVTRPFIKNVTSTLTQNQVNVLLDGMYEVGVSEQKRSNWKNKFYSDFWATKTPSLFLDYNNNVDQNA